MASKKTLVALLQIVHTALGQAIEALEKEETLPETSSIEVAEQQTVTTIEQPTVAPASALVVAEEPSAPATPVHLPTPVPELFDVVQPAPALSKGEIEMWERRTDDVLSRGNFREMGSLKDDLPPGLPHLVARIEDKFTEQNVEQAKRLLDDHNETVASLEQFLKQDDAENAQLVLDQDCTRIGGRLRTINRHAAAQLEKLTGRKLGEIRSQFVLKVSGARQKIERIETARAEATESTVRELLTKTAAPKVAANVKRTIGSIKANKNSGNVSAAASQLRELQSSPENVAAAIQQLGKEEYEALCWGIEAATITGQKKSA